MGGLEHTEQVILELIFMKKILRYILESIAIFGLIGCGIVDRFGSTPNTNPTQPGNILLELQFESQAQRDALKFDFLNNISINLNPPIQGSALQRFNLNTTRNQDGAPLSPVVHTYNFLNPAVQLSVSLPCQFFDNIPYEITEEIKKHPIRSLDLLFTPQNGMFSSLEYDSGHPPSLKPAYWVFPNMPRLDTVGEPGIGAEVFMAIYQSSQSIEAQVKNQVLSPFASYAHGGRISPANGHLGIPQGATNITFWSLVIHKPSHRAAVTLHWLLGEDQRSHLEQAVLNTYNGNPGQNNLFSVREYLNTTQYNGLDFPIEILNTLSILMGPY
jgi:hypothetical protein